MNKFRSSKELKEAIQNVDKVIETDSIDAVVEVDPILASAYIENKDAEQHVEEILDELTDKAEEVVEDSPEASLPLENIYTKSLKLDESIEDFRLCEDGRKHREAARDDNDTDLYLDYDMSEFVYEMLSAGSKGITNIAPKTPLAKQVKNKVEGLYPIKKFSPNGSQVNNRQYILLFDLSPSCSRDVSLGMKKLPESVKALAEKYAYQADSKHMGAIEAFDTFTSLAYDEAEKVYENSKTRFKDPNVNKATYINDLLGYTFVGFTKELGTPQIGQAGYDTVVYANNVDTLEIARDGVARTYNIECGPVVPRRSVTSHWDYSMVVYCPKYEDGEPMMLEDYLEENNLTLDDVFTPEVAGRFKNAFAAADALDAEFKKDKLIDDIIDDYADRAMDIDPDDYDAMMDLYNEMCKTLSDNSINCDNSIKNRFTDETGFEF